MQFTDEVRNRVGVFQLIEDVDQTDLKTAFSERTERINCLFEIAKTCDFTMLSSAIRGRFLATMQTAFEEQQAILRRMSQSVTTAVEDA